MRTNCQGRLRRSRRLSRLSRPRQWISHSLRTPLKLPFKEEFVALMSCSSKTIGLNVTICILKVVMQSDLAK